MSRKTQAERRTETQANLLAAARQLFGENGYSDTAIGDIAAACGLTVRPIYHYFDSKLGLFKAVTQQIEQELIDNMNRNNPSGVQDILSGFMTRCEDPHFRQIMLIDGPVLISTMRPGESAVIKSSRERTAGIFGARPDGITMSLLMGALTEAAHYIAKHGASDRDYGKIRDLVDFLSQSNAQEAAARMQE